MKLTRKEIAVLGVCVVMVVGTVVAIVSGRWEPAVASLAVLQLVTIWLCLTILRRRPVSHSAVLNRIEQRLDEVSHRVVTESQATARELSGLAEQIRPVAPADKSSDRP